MTRALLFILLVLPAPVLACSGGWWSLDGVWPPDGARDVTPDAAIMLLATSSGPEPPDAQADVKLTGPEGVVELREESAGGGSLALRPESPLPAGEYELVVSDYDVALSTVPIERTFTVVEGAAPALLAPKLSLKTRIVHIANDCEDSCDECQYDEPVDIVVADLQVTGPESLGRATIVALKFAPSLDELSERPNERRHADERGALDTSHAFGRRFEDARKVCVEVTLLDPFGQSSVASTCVDIEEPEQEDSGCQSVPGSLPPALLMLLCLAVRRRS
jgi:hypothetical protein